MFFINRYSAYSNYAAIFYKENIRFFLLIAGMFVLPIIAVANESEVVSSIETCSQALPSADGPIQGYSEVSRQGKTICAYKGIPYAKPPIGKLRWKAPLAPVKRDTIFTADTFIDDCVQDWDFAGFMNKTKAKGMSENCLGLNIWRPANLEKDKVLPVMVWFHGGGYLLGSGAWPTYNGTNLADQQNVVVVTVNYRLNVFGFLSHEDLIDVNDGYNGGSAGNYGILDQQFALQWIKNNIMNFSGDANNVTIFGESAGGWSVVTHLISPASKSLFHKAIIQSGGSDAAIDSDKAFKMGESLAQSVSCEGKNIAQCLRQKPAEELFENATIRAWSCRGNTTMEIMQCNFPRKDGVLIPDTPIALIKKGQYKKVPVLAGYTGLDGSMLIRSTKETFSVMSGHSKYLYEFQYKNYALDFIASGMHGAEITYVFDTMKAAVRVNGRFSQYSEAQMKKAQPFVDQVQSYWGNFARSGNPNGQTFKGESLPTWPDYEEGQGKNILALKNIIKVENLED